MIREAVQLFFDKLPFDQNIEVELDNTYQAVSIFTYTFANGFSISYKETKSNPMIFKRLLSVDDVYIELFDGGLYKEEITLFNNTLKKIENIYKNNNYNKFYEKVRSKC